MTFALYVRQIYIKWLIQPDILVRVNQKFLSEIPFPALTLCSSLFARDHLANVRSFHNELAKSGFQKAPNITTSEANYILSNLQTCNPSSLDPKIVGQLQQNESDVVKLLNESFLNTNEVLSSCYYKGKCDKNCDTMFNRVLTDRGFCYSFNMQGFNTIFNTDVVAENMNSFKRRTIRKSPYLDHKSHNEVIIDETEKLKWTLQEGFLPDNDKDEIPVAAQRDNWITAFLLLNKSDSENLCGIYGKTFNFYIHLPNEIPTSLFRRNYVRFYEKKVVDIEAKSFKVDKELRKFTPEARGCYFDGERILKFFKYYTKKNCEYECLVDYVRRQCGCVKFSMPRDEKTRLCNASEAKCYHDAMNKWPEYDPSTKDFSASCGCLNPCNNIEYKIQFEETSELDVKILKNSSHHDNSFSLLVFIFRDHLIEEEEQYAPYAFKNFLADIGGLLGFFMGCSLLSIIEIFFFLIWMISATIAKLTRFNKNDFSHEEKPIVNFINVKPKNSTDDVYLCQLQYYQLKQEIDQRLKMHHDMIKKRDEDLMIILKHMSERLNTTSSSSINMKT